MKTVLYINGRFAVWMCFERGACVNLHVEALVIGEAAYQPCKWLHSKRRLVHLVIDSEHTEIDAYPLQRIGSLMRQFSDAKALRKSLVERFPNAIIRSPAKRAGLEAVMVQKPGLTELHRKWIAYVETSVVTFCSVATSAEIEANLFENSNQPYLVISNVLGSCKYTLCRSGYALFTRTLEYTDKLSVVDGLKETLSHLSTTELINSAVRVYLVGISVQQSKNMGRLELVDKIVRCNLAVANGFAKHIGSDDVIRQYAAVALIAKNSLKPLLLKQHSARRYVTLPLEKWSTLARRIRSYARLAAVTALAVCSVAYSGSKHWDDHQREYENRQVKDALSQTVAQTREALLARSPIGFEISKALFDTSSLKTIAGPGPTVVLPIIANVFTEHREVTLQELSWITLDDVALAETNFAFDASQQVSFRKNITLQPATPSKLLVNVVGMSNPQTDLRKQQNEIDSLVAMLEQHSLVNRLKVLEAPLKADYDDRIGTDALDLTNRFRIQFQLARVSNIEN